MFRSRRRAARSAAAALSAAALVTSLAACSSGGDDSSSGNRDASTSDGPPNAQITSALGKVTGKLDQQASRQVQARVTRVVDEWFDAAYVAGDYPRTDFAEAFPVFTRGAATRARTDRALMSNATLGSKIDDVHVYHRDLRIDVLAVDGRAAGVTVRFALGMRLSGEIDRRDRVSGRLFLTHGPGRWQIFGYDVNRMSV